MDKAKLTQRAGERDSAGLAEIYARYQQNIFRYVYFMVGDVATSEDLTGDVFVHLAESIDQAPLQGDCPLPYLYSVARDLIAVSHQHAERSSAAQVEGRATADGVKYWSTSEQQPSPQHLACALSHLTDDLRRLIVLKFVEGLGNETVAQIMGKATDAIQPLQPQALAALASAMARCEATPPPQSQEGEPEQLHNTFIQNVAHGLRTPLTLIRSYTDLLLSDTLGPLQPEQRDALEVVYDRAGELTGVIRNLTSTQDIRKESLTLVPLSVPGWIETTIDQYRHNAQEAGVQFETNLPGDLPQIAGDQKRLGVALSQILDNAIKFSPDGGLVHVQAWQDAGYLHVAVRDE